MKQKIKLGIILGVEFIAITVILILIFFAGKKSYRVTFDLNGGTLIAGDLEQVVAQGKNATPPTVAKDGCYLHSWSGSYRQVTRDVVITAGWEGETSIGFDYTSSEDSDYCEIEKCFKDLTGDVYVGVYHNGKKVLGIRNEAFRDCDEITYIHMLDGILSIGESVFRDCDSLIAVELPGTLVKLGDYAFMDCDNLEKIELPRNLQSIPEGAFANCASLETVVISASVKSIEAGAFEGCTSLKEIAIPASVTVIEAGAFKNCTSLKEIIIPASVTAIEDGAFEGCTSLEKITFEVEEEVTVDEEENEITVYSGLESIGAGAFMNCPELLEITLPVTVETIGEYAFDNELLTVSTPISEEDKPDGWAENWCNAEIVWEYEESVPEADGSNENGRK